MGTNGKNVIIGIHEEGVHVLTSDNDLEFAIVCQSVSGFNLWDNFIK